MDLTDKTDKKQIFIDLMAKFIQLVDITAKVLCEKASSSLKKIIILAHKGGCHRAIIQSRQALCPVYKFGQLIFAFSLVGCGS